MVVGEGGRSSGFLLYKQKQNRYMYSNETQEALQCNDKKTAIFSSECDFDQE